ncbi:kinase-like domain-containing protein [Aspergillus keveii]|uniref:Kinase-like domain-containing protein n=1 Tax=Aspergillus keveii TaxID=714993 RepID=A0ABR4G752_9EURO
MAGPLRQPIDIHSLTNYITTHVPEIQTPITLSQFGFGQSNPTYLLTSSTGQKSVLRKKPPGKLVSASAHKVEREYRILKALEGTSIPVPRTYCLCTDESILGTPFYIMEFLDGRIFEDASFPGVTAEDRRVMWREAMRILARFHSLDPKEVGLEGYGRSGGFYARQLETWRGLARAQGSVADFESGEAVGDVPAIERMIAFFSDARYQPADRATLIHGDFKIDNLVFHKTEPRIIGILDWEMSTVGHPLADIANVVHPWTINALSPRAACDIGLPHDIADIPGLPSVAQCVSWYAEEAGWDPASELRWAEAFCLFRLSIIYQGIAARYAARQATSAKARELGRAMYPCAELAERVIREIEDKDTDRARL